jgi:hypothetical protein
LEARKAAETNRDALADTQSTDERLHLRTEPADHLVRADGAPAAAVTF